MSVAELQRAREMIALSNHADRVVLPSVIADSWERCATALSTLEHGETPVEDAAPRDQWDYDLLLAAQGPTAGLVNQFDELIGGVVVADAAGRLLMVSYSGARARDMLELIQVLPGALFGEESVGTNGIGTPLVARTAVHVTGEQHLRYEYHPYTCAGVPITDPITGRMLGTLGIIGWGEHIKHAGGLMKLALVDAARGIKRELATHPQNRGMTQVPGFSVNVSARTSTGSAAWKKAQDDLDASLRRGDNVLVLGETSSGRMTATVDAYRRVRPGSLSTVLRPDEIERRLSNRHAPVKVVPRDQQLIVLRDIHRLSARAVTSLARSLSTREPGVQLAATCSPHVLEGRTGVATLLPLFEHTSTVPALRQHLADLPTIVTQILRILSPSQPRHLHPDALALLERCAWPGNLEQLTDVLAAAAHRASGTTIFVEDFPHYVVATDRISLMERTERDAILRAYYQMSRNKSQAADALGISRSTLYRKIAAYGVDDV